MAGTTIFFVKSHPRGLWLHLRPEVHTGRQPCACLTPADPARGPLPPHRQPQPGHAETRRHKGLKEGVPSPRQLTGQIIGGLAAPPPRRDSAQHLRPAGDRPQPRTLASSWRRLARLSGALMPRLTAFWGPLRVVSPREHWIPFLSLSI